ncbi:MAG: Maf family protein [Candidatus Pacebacteria bacterium]|nr:Maf family protein [Candidatus Paceibacterota bacterium]
MKLILGSSSKYRKNILKKAGYVFDILVPDIDEKLIEINDPYQRPLVVARAKAEILIPQIKEPALLITSDVIAVCNGKVREKPNTKEEAREFLREYSKGIVPEGVTAIVIYNTVTKKYYEAIDIARVFFDEFSEAVIEDFIENGDVLGRAGGFGVQSPILRPYVKEIKGDEESIVGMPVALLKKLLKQAGYQIGF